MIVTVRQMNEALSLVSPPLCRDNFDPKISNYLSQNIEFCLRAGLQEINLPDELDLVAEAIIELSELYRRGRRMGRYGAGSRRR